MNIELLSTAVVDAQTESIEFDGLVTNECPVCDKVCRTTPSNHTHKLTGDSFAYMLCVGCNLIWELNRPEHKIWTCLLYTSPSPRDRTRSRMPSSA